MGLKETIEMEDLVNESERFVLEELELQLSRIGEEYSLDYILDMAAYALNKVPAKYRVNLLGRLFSSVTDESYLAQVRKSVSEAISVVTNNPPRV